MLEVDVGHRLGDFSLEIAFSAGPGVTALFGPSGAGKSSLISILAGLATPLRGRVVLDGTPLVDRAAGIFVKARRRRIGTVFQETRLFPHLSVQHNLLYGCRLTPKVERFVTLAEVVSLLGLEKLLQRRPGLLSGGEKQRVAIGRALLTSPRLLLMDEPLSSLDEARRQEILPYLERLRDRARMPIIYVSHNRSEVDRLASLVVMIENGRVTGLHGPSEIAR